MEINNRNKKNNSIKTFSEQLDELKETESKHEISTNVAYIFMAPVFIIIFIILIYSLIGFGIAFSWIIIPSCLIYLYKHKTTIKKC